MDVFQSDAVVEQLLLLVSEMPKPVPLRRDLCVECPDIVVDDSRGFVDELLVEERSIEKGLLR